MSSSIPVGYGSVTAAAADRCCRRPLLPPTAAAADRCCPVCGKQPDSPRATYCSDSHRQLAYRLFCRSLGAGGLCLHCDQPVAVSDLLAP